MKKMNVGKKQNPTKIGSDFFEVLWERSWTYIKTVVDVAREPMLILDKDFKVMAANDAFYQTFNVTEQNTEGKNLFKLGNGQWDIPILRKFIKEVASKQTYFKGFQVAHNFPVIGRKVMILNARQIHILDEVNPGVFPPIILLAIEDVTDMMVAAESLSNHAKDIETKMLARTEKLEIHIERLQNEINRIKNKK